jgi:hypothetical protein
MVVGWQRGTIWPCGFHLEQRMCGVCAGGMQVQRRRRRRVERKATAAGRGEKGEMDREARLGLRGGKWLDRGLILQTLRAFFCKIDDNRCRHAKAPPMLQILWWLRRRHRCSKFCGGYKLEWVLNNPDCGPNRPLRYTRSFIRLFKSVYIIL